LYRTVPSCKLRAAASTAAAIRAYSPILIPSPNHHFRSLADSSQPFLRLAAHELGLLPQSADNVWPNDERILASGIPGPGNEVQAAILEQSDQLIGIVEFVPLNLTVRLSDFLSMPFVFIDILALFRRIRVKRLRIAS